MKIAVIGAGISGLTFAAAMQRFSPETKVDVYERDQGLTSRPQGYTRPQRRPGAGGSQNPGAV